MDKCLELFSHTVMQIKDTQFFLMKIDPLACVLNLTGIFIEMIKYLNVKFLSFYQLISYLAPNNDDLFKLHFNQVNVQFTAALANPASAIV